MSKKPQDSSGADLALRQPQTADGEPAIVRLEKALAEETRTSAELREHLESLRQKVDEIASGFEKRLEDATTRSNAAEARLADQQVRLHALGSGREESMRALAETRAQLARTQAERDQLSKRLAQIEGMQTATLTLPEEWPDEEPGIHAQLPSIEELMASLHSFEEGGKDATAGHLHMRAEKPFDEEESQIMIAPELVFPEEYAEESASSKEAHKHGPISKLLVFLDAEQPIKYPLYKDVMTIGRSESADIQVRGDFISRIHARVVAANGGFVVEDVDSKNGIKVNSRLTDRHPLQHGDVIGLGRLRFTYIDTASRAD